MTQEDAHRCLTLVDHTRKETVRTQFDHPCEMSEDIDVVAALFNDTVYQLLRSGGNHIYTVDTLPILRAIGPRQDTMIVRVTENDIVIGNRETTPMTLASHFGLENL